jgi:hypothetical protein
MKRTIVFVIAFALLVITAHRLPASIQKVPESPTLAPTVAPAAQPRKSPPKPKSKPTGAARFAGTWIGQISIGKFIDTDVTLVISADGTSVAQRSRAGAWTRPLTYDGKRLSWQTGPEPTNMVAWTLTLEPDEQSAVVTRRWAGKWRSRGTQSEGIFSRSFVH